MSQTVATLLRLRELILDGALPPGERLSELALVERLGASRTPVRAALARLAEEGLVEPIPSGGYSVRAFSERDIHDAIELRGTLEGLAARFAAERGAGRTKLAALRAEVALLDGLLTQPAMSDTDFGGYVQANARFHATLVDMADSPPLAREIERVTALPFASPSSFVMAQSALPEARTILVVGNDQHRCVIDAIEAREGARAEALMREHARLARRNLVLALASRTTSPLLPGGSLPGLSLPGLGLIDLRRRA